MVKKKFVSLNFIFMLDFTKKTMRDGVIPTQNLPEKCIPRTPIVERSNASITNCETFQKQIQKEQESATITKLTYKDFDEFRNKIAKLKLINWDITENGDKQKFFAIVKPGKEHVIPSNEIYVNEHLEISLRCLG